MSLPRPSFRRRSLLAWLRLLLLLLPALWLAGEMAFSLRWRIAHDQAPLLYETYLMGTEGRLPYRDLFDFQMPGTYAVYFLLGWASRFNDFRLRLLDLALLFALLSLTFLFMRRFGWKSALLAALLFGLKYLQGGPSLALQREYLLLFFLASGLWLTFAATKTWLTFLLLGLCFGIAATIKPHAAIGLLPLLLAELLPAPGASKRTSSAIRTRVLLPALGGFLLPLAALTFWLARGGMLAPFLEIARNYWPLYAQINGEMEVPPGAARWLFILKQTARLGGNAVWLLPAGLGLILAESAFRPFPIRLRQVFILAGLTLVYALYPAFSGQFFDYHWLPFLYFVFLLASLCLLEDTSPRWQVAATLALLLAIAVNLRPPVVMLRQIAGKPIAPLGGRIDRMAEFLQKQLRPGDTVQPLDWTGGTLQAMLISRASLATPFVFDFYFYHHVSHPYIQGLRTRFLQALQAHPPRFILEITSADKPWVSGTDTSRDFPALRQFLAENYRPIQQKEDYVIYEHR
ncbi:MAG: hypothetical protein ACP5QU_08565 [Anaerolineae bacterium]